MADTMKAVVVRAPMDFSVEDVPVPACPEGGLLLEVLACGLCGSDLRTLRSGHRKVTFPWIIGHEVCGTVVEVGRGCAGRYRKGEVLAVGPNAYCGVCDYCVGGRYELCEGYREIAQAWPGAFAEFLAVPEECVRLGDICPMPEGLDPVVATLSEPLASVVNAQEKGEVGVGDTVMVIGAGPIGCAHASLARARGADRVFIADISEDRLRSAGAFGVDAAIDASKLDLVSEVKRLTGGKGAHVVVTATPAPVAVVQALSAARKGGRILVFGGLPVGNSKIEVDANVIHYNSLRVIGTSSFAPRHQRTALQLLASGRIPGEKLISHRFPLIEFEKGATLALEGKTLKAVFLP